MIFKPTTSTSSIQAWISSELPALPTFDVLSTVPPTFVHKQVKLVILIPVSGTIILINAILLIFLISHTRLHRPSYFFVGCMSLADLCVGCVSVWTTEWAVDNAFLPCLVRMSLMTSVVVASLLSMGCSALDRYISIMCPLAYNKKVTKWRAVCVMFFLWLTAFCIGFAPLMGWDVHHSTVLCSFCYIDSIEYEVFLFLVGFGVPMTTTIIIYILLFKNARVHIQKLEAAAHISLGNKGQLQPRSRCFWRSRRWRSSRTLVLMISCFLITWCPFVVTSVVQMICADSCHLKDFIGTYLLLLGFCNSFLNPLIYAVSNREFKSVAKTCWTNLRGRLCIKCKSTTTTTS